MSKARLDLAARVVIVVAIFGLVLSCADDEKEAFKCDGAVPSLLVDLEVGSIVKGSSATVSDSTKALFEATVPDRYESGSYCNDSYDFNQFNTDTFDWCYYYAIDVDCDTNAVSSIYTDAP